MHVLVINDDGPPSQASSPYVHSFVQELQQVGVKVSVVLPDTQRSWIGKAHLVGKTVTPTYFIPGTLHKDDGTTHTRPRQDGGEEWILVDGTPASCAQIGIHHYFEEKGPIDLVVSGPNYGRNSTALFALSSGTVGGAMEAAVCGKRAISLSYAFHSRNHDPEIIKGASLVSVRIVKYLHENWHEGVDLYAVNVPLIEGIDKPEAKILYTNMLQNYWTSGSTFEPVDAEEDASPEVREQGENGNDDTQSMVKKVKHLKFKWAPKFGDVYGSVEKSEPGNDGWAVWKGYVSITPLNANFMHFDGGLLGQELHLGNNETALQIRASKLGLENNNNDDENIIYILVDCDDVYVKPKILAALQTHLTCMRVIEDLSELPGRQNVKLLDWSAYEKIYFEKIIENPNSMLCCSYIIRKALIRKHHLSLTVRHHAAKNPASILTTSFPQTCDFELDFAEFLDEALVEAYELQESLADNEGREPGKRKWWILKPGMSDRGQGIKLFSTIEDLTEIFVSMEGKSDEDYSDEDDVNDSSVVTQLRHFVAQEYIHPPLLAEKRKFHIRTYVLAVGGLKVFVYKHMLALFAAKEYSPPWENDDLMVHLTNTCLQSGEREGSVKLLSDLENDIGNDCVRSVCGKISTIVAEIFEGAARSQRIHFQPLPNAFEIFGIDFMASADMNVHLLEVNSYPDFKQTGEVLSDVISGLFEHTVKYAVAPFFDVNFQGSFGDNMEKVLDIKIGSW